MNAFVYNMTVQYKVFTQWLLTSIDHLRQTTLALIAKPTKQNNSNPIGKVFQTWRKQSLIKVQAFLQLLYKQ